MADLSAQRLPLSGLQPVYSAADPAGDTAPIGQRTVLHVKNGGAAPITVTVATPQQYGDLDIADATQTVPVDGDAFVCMSNAYRDPTTGRASIAYDDATSVDVAVLQLP